MGKLGKVSALLAGAAIVFMVAFFLGQNSKSGTFTVITEAQRDAGVTSTGVAVSGTTAGAALSPPDTTPAEARGRIDINTAGLEELCDLPRIGPVMAQRIIDDRESNGLFVTPDDLLRVSGIGEKTLEQLEPLILPLRAESSTAEDESQ